MNSAHDFFAPTGAMLPEKLTQPDLIPGLPRVNRANEGLGPKGGKHYTRPNGYAARPGSGPAGETCKSCAHYCRRQGGARAYPKCELMKHAWTGGPGSDILASSPACERWEKKEVNS